MGGAACGRWDKQADRRAVRGEAARAPLLLALTLELGLGLTAAGGEIRGLVGDDAGQFVAQPVNGGLQGIVEHVPDHGHAALHPLAWAAEVRVLELGQAPPPSDQCVQHVAHGFGADAVAIRQIFDQSLSLGRELAHFDLHSLIGMLISGLPT